MAKRRSAVIEARLAVEMITVVKAMQDKMFVAVCRASLLSWRTV